jgi:hypothetical protein
MPAEATSKAEAHTRFGAASPFDLTLARFPILQLPVDEVIDLLHITHAPDRIAQYRESMQRGDLFPPVSVIRLGGRYFLADGHKRFNAYRGVRGRHINVEVWTRRHWIADQWRQLVNRSRLQLSLLRHSTHDPRARTQALNLIGFTLSHWRRIATSLLRLGERTDRHGGVS